MVLVAMHGPGTLEELIILLGRDLMRCEIYVLKTDMANLVKSSTVLLYAALLKSGQVTLERVVVSPT